MLENTGTRLSALGSSVRDSDSEAGLVGACTTSVGCKVVPGLQWLANDSVVAGPDNGNVGGTGVRSTGSEGDGNDLTGGVALNLVGIVGVLQTLAHVCPAVGGLVVWLLGRNIEQALNITVGVGGDLVVSLHTASGLESRARSTRSGISYDTVGTGRGEEPGRSQDGGVGLHCDVMISECSGNSIVRDS